VPVLPPDIAERGGTVDARIRSLPTALPADLPAEHSADRANASARKMIGGPRHRSSLELGANNPHSTQRIAKALAKGLVIGAGLLVRGTGFFCAFCG
jgi:hypothetical protein